VVCIGMRLAIYSGLQRQAVRRAAMAVAASCSNLHTSGSSLDRKTNRFYAQSVT